MVQTPGTLRTGNAQAPASLTGGLDQSTSCGLDTAAHSLIYDPGCLIRVDRFRAGSSVGSLGSGVRSGRWHRREGSLHLWSVRLSAPLAPRCRPAVAELPRRPYSVQLPGRGSPAHRNAPHTEAASGLEARQEPDRGAKQTHEAGAEAEVVESFSDARYGTVRYFSHPEAYWRP